MGKLREIEKLVQSHTACECWSRYLHLRQSSWVLFAWPWLSHRPNVSVAGFKSLWLLSLYWSILSIFLGSSLCSKHSLPRKSCPLPPPPCGSPFPFSQIVDVVFILLPFAPLMYIKRYKNDLPNHLISLLGFKLYECRTYLQCPSLPC